VAQAGKTQKNSKKYFIITLMSQPFSSMNKDNLHHPEPEKPDNGPASKKPAGRHTSSLWELFTEDVDPQCQTRSFCHNCHKSVYHKKFERVKEHLTYQMSHVH